MCSGPQKAVDYVVTVDVGSRDRACLVDACWERTLESACARARNVATSTRTALAQTLAKAAQQVSESEALPVKTLSG